VLLLDLLIGTLIVLPLLADALWYNLSDFYSLELSDMGVPVLAVGLIFLMVRRISRQSFKLGAAAQRCRAAALAGLDALRRMPRRTLWRAGGIVGMLVAVVVLLSFWAIANHLGGADLASEALWVLTHGTGAVAVVGLGAAMVRRWSPEPWERSFFLRQGANVTRAWLAAVERSPVIALWGTVAVLAAFFFWIGLLRYRAFESHGFDLGIFTNAMWNLTHGNGYVSSVKGGINLFQDHQSPLFWAVAPFFWMVPRPETLLVVQALGLAAGGPALYYLGRAQFGPSHWAPAALPWLYWCWLPLRNAAAFDFHPEVFMLPLMLWACVGFASDRPWAKALGLLALVAALGAKESSGVVVAGIGFGWALTGGLGPRRARWPGIALVVAGAAVFWLDVKIVPAMFGGEYAYMDLYERFGGGIGAVLLAPFTQPAYFFSQFFNPARLNFLVWTLAPLAFLPLFDWRAAVAALPPYLMLFLAEGDQRVKIIFHYGIEPGTRVLGAPVRAGCLCPAVRLAAGGHLDALLRCGVPRTHRAEPGARLPAHSARGVAEERSLAVPRPGGGDGRVRCPRRPSRNAALDKLSLSTRAETIGRSRRLRRDGPQHQNGQLADRKVGNGKNPGRVARARVPRGISMRRLQRP
jgi:hypothetical protein